MALRRGRKRSGTGRRKRPLRGLRGRPRAARSERPDSERPRSERPVRRPGGRQGATTLSRRAGEARTAGIAIARLLGGALQEIGRAALATAEWLGRLELRLAQLVSGPLRATVRAARAAIRAGERAITPPRAVAAVILCAAVLLGVSQFVDYRGVGIGVPLYEGVEAVAPAPQTDRQPAGSAHAYVLLPAALLAIGAMAFALRGRWQLGRAVSLIGAAGILITLLIDRPQGLDEGAAALGFEGAEAMLVEGFWVQLSASVVLLVTGALLSRYVRAEQPAERRGRRPRRRSARRRRGGAAPAAGARA